MQNRQLLLDRNESNPMLMGLLELVREDSQAMQKNQQELNKAMEENADIAGLMENHKKAQGELPFKNLDYLFIPGIKQAVIDKADSIKAYVVTEEGLKEFSVRLGELTDEERQIILKGCLINYNRV